MRLRQEDYKFTASSKMGPHLKLKGGWRCSSTLSEFNPTTAKIKKNKTRQDFSETHPLGFFFYLELNHRDQRVMWILSSKSIYCRLSMFLVNCQMRWERDSKEYKKGSQPIKGKTIKLGSPNSNYQYFLNNFIYSFSKLLFQAWNVPAVPLSWDYGDMISVLRSS